MPSVTRKTTSSRAERRDEIRRRLIEAAEEVLQDGESFTEISVERLVTEAGISRSTFYVYFEDKGDLLRAWVAEVTEQLDNAVESWWNLSPDATRADLREALSHLVHTYVPHTTLMAALYDAAAYDPSVRDTVDAMMGRNIAGLRRHIAEGQRAGTIDPDLLPEETSAWLMWMAERGLHQVVRQASEAEIERLIDAYTAIIWHTLYAPALRHASA